MTLRILHICATLERGGAEAILADLAAALAARNISTAVVCLKARGPYRDILKNHDIPVYDLGMEGGLSLPGAISRFRKIVKDYKPTVIHAWMYHAIFLCFLSGYARKTLGAVHHSLNDLKNEKTATALIIRILSFISHKFSLFTYCSETSLKQHIEFGFSSRNARYIPNGFDSRKYKPNDETRSNMRASLGLNDGDFVIGHIGRFHPVKDHATLVTAFHKFRTIHKNAHLVLIGTNIDHENKELLSYMNSDDLENIHLIGESSRIPDYLCVFDIYVNSSRSEALPSVVAEAMSSGVPCIATDVGDTAQLLSEFGYLVPSGDPDAILQALIDFETLSDALRKDMGRKARVHIVSHYSSERFHKSYIEVYRRLSLRPS